MRLEGPVFAAVAEADEARNSGGSKVGSAVVTEADGDEKSGAGPLLMERPPLVGARFRIGRFPGLAGIVINPVQNGASGGQGLGGRSELAEIEVSEAVRGGGG